MTPEEYNTAFHKGMLAGIEKCIRIIEEHKED